VGAGALYHRVCSLNSMIVSLCQIWPKDDVDLLAVIWMKPFVIFGFCGYYSI